jgi:hypothetical protein
MKHEARKHAVWAASAAHRNMACPGALTLELELPPTLRRTSVAMATGTAMHQIAERLLRGGGDAVDLVGETEQADDMGIPIDEEIAHGIDAYLTFCRDLARIAHSSWIEEKFSLDWLGIPFEAGGTADFVAWLHGEKQLVVVDLKGGKGVLVEALRNAQMRHYALGVLLKHPDISAQVKTVRIVIVQPRAPHRDGLVRDEVFEVADLLEWVADLKDAMALSDEAMHAYALARKNSVLADVWRDQWLKPGDCCQFCPAEGVCPALRHDALSLVDDWWEDDMSNLPAGNSPEEIAADLIKLERLNDWANARRQLAQQMAESGIDIPGFMLVDKRGTRRWVEKDEKAAALLISDATGIAEDGLYNRTLKSPAQVDKLLTASRRKQTEPLWRMEVSGKNLVQRDKSNRPEVKSLVSEHMEKIDEI